METFSAKRIQDGPKSSTTFGEKDKPPALPCRDNVVVENGAAAPKLCLSLFKMRTTTAVGGLLLTGKTTKATWTTLDRPTLRLYLTKEKIGGLQLHQTSTTAVSGEITCLLPPPAGGSLRQNWGKIGCSI